MISLNVLSSQKGTVEVGQIKAGYGGVTVVFAVACGAWMSGWDDALRM